MSDTGLLVGLLLVFAGGMFFGATMKSCEDRPVIAAHEAVADCMANKTSSCAECLEQAK